jgi:hypothetical protein
LIRYCLRILLNHDCANLQSKRKWKDLKPGKSHHHVMHRITKFPLIGLGWEGRQCWGVEAVSRQVEFECFGYGSEGEPGGGEMEGRAVAEE